ncbi:hypothetical protein A2617_03050 [Candidatus Daviesbacteria bacterium RIFOXYD1_FULL_41_10]|uniref:Uncharacterized protein n=1 Tax=Candidatus Daviesbacteria bacterium RIFOXYD1_FULL_41_10 TaxID=1797801 RepID=A0A1F5MZR7_9BACT|nr:MAG: hypothetical protein A2617_03050 [Candidatus Daviesbacteria bacterium RIFOXYD1_FULL_41_10]
MAERKGEVSKLVEGTVELAKAMAKADPLALTLGGIIYHPEVIARWQRREARQAGQSKHSIPTTPYCKGCI